MGLGQWPAFAAWEHLVARRGFEVSFFREGGARIEGCTTAVEDGEPWTVHYRIELDAQACTRRAIVLGRARSGSFERVLTGDGAGHWRVDGMPAAELDGCLDVDLESSALTNAFPIRRLALAIDEAADAPAAYVRALDLRVERVAQHYRRIDAHGYDYRSPAFAFQAVIRYDAQGLAIDYPGIAVRVA